MFVINRKLQDWAGRERTVPLEEDGDLVACDGHFRRVLDRFAVDILDRLPHCLKLLDLAGSDLKISIKIFSYKKCIT